MPEVLSLQLTGWFHPMRGGGASVSAAREGGSRKHLLRLTGNATQEVLEMFCVQRLEKKVFSLLRSAFDPSAANKPALVCHAPGHRAPC